MVKIIHKEEHFCLLSLLSVLLIAHHIKELTYVCEQRLLYVNITVESSHYSLTHLITGLRDKMTM